MRQSSLALRLPCATNYDLQLKPSYHIVTPARVIFLSRSYADGRSRLRVRTAHNFEIKKERACRKLICSDSEKKTP